MLTTFIVLSMRVQPDQCLTRTDGYLLAYLLFFLKLNGSQDKGLTLPKEPEDLLQTVIQPCPLD